MAVNMETNDGEPRGVGGWLGFFVITIALLGPLRLVVTASISLYGDPQVAAAYGATWPRIQMAEWAIIAGSLLVHWFVAWRLWKVHVWSSVRIALAGIWALAIGGTLLDLLAVSLIAGIPFDALAGATLGPKTVQPFFFCALWTAYFLRSERVANTYARAATGEGVAEVFR